MPAVLTTIQCGHLTQSLLCVKHFGLLCGVPHSAPRLSDPGDFKEAGARGNQAQFSKVHNWVLGLVA